MIKKPKRKLLFITVFLTILLSSSSYAALIPNVHAAEPSTQEKISVSIPKVNMTTSAIQEKGLPILSNVLGLDLAKYATTSQECPQDSYMGVVPEENVRYALESNGSKLDMLYTFANGNLRMIHVLESEGSPFMTKSVNGMVEMAQGFLSNYQSYSGNSFYGGLGSMLDKVDANKNLTITSGNVKLEVNASEGSTIFRWTYTYNGIGAPDKCVALCYENGFLKYFIDNWDLYKIGSTTVNLSEKEAIDIAMERARTFSWNMGSGNATVKIMNFKVTNAMIWENVFCSNLYADEARSEDPLMLYPVRHVWVSLDKFYPGNVYGIEVYLWADTKDVAHIQERFSTLDPPADLVATMNDFTVEPLSDQVSVGEAKSNSMSLVWVALPAFAAVTLGAIPVWFLHSKKKNLPRRIFKIGGILLCLLMSSTMLLTSISVVNAESTRRALIWGSTSAGAPNPPYGSSWRKTPDEIYRQGVTSNTISNYFRDDGYITNNYQGNGSIKAQILTNLSYSETNYANVAAVDFDHGVGRSDYLGDYGKFHYMFEDNIGTVTGPPNNQQQHPENGVYDMDVYKNTTDKTFFALINTCASANLDYQNYNGGKAQGMPYAWTHRYVGPQAGSGANLSINGYGYPDNSLFCYLGFPSGSAALAQTISGIAPIYATWVENFFWYALTADMSVNQALDQASLRNFNNLFGNTALATGFTAIWPMDTNGDGYWEPTYGPNSRLVVYGNGNIHLYEYFVHDVVSATWYGYYAGVNNPNGITGGSNDGSYACLYAVGRVGDEAMIVGHMSADTAHGHIYLYGCSYPGYNSHLYVYVSYDGSNYDYVNNLWISQSSPYWINVGSHSGNFRYIAVVVYADYAPAVLYVDSVLVIPPLP